MRLGAEPTRTALLDASAQESRARRFGRSGAIDGDVGHLLPASMASRQVQGTQLMRSAAEGDSTLLLGGDLIVTVYSARGLSGQARLTHPFARVRVGGQSQLTTVAWQSLEPLWEETLLFRDISAAAELLVEAWDVGGAKRPEQLQRLATDPARVVANSRFLGRVEVPLSETLSLRPREFHRLFGECHQLC